MVMPREPAYGTPEICPQRPMDMGPGTPVDTRCTHNDGIGSGVTTLRGKVLGQEADGISATGLGGMRIAVHRIDDKTGRPGKEMAHAMTDAQGSFSMAAMLGPGEYVVYASAGEGGPPLGQSRLTLVDTARRSLDGVVIRLAMDPRMGGSPP